MAGKCGRNGKIAVRLESANYVTERIDTTNHSTMRSSKIRTPDRKSLKM